MAEHDSVLGRLFFNKHETMTQCEKSFTRDVAHIQTSPTQLLIFLYDRRL